MRSRWITALALAALALPSIVAAQDAPAPGPTLDVQSMQVAPAQVPRFEATIEKVVKASNEAALGAEFGWGVWTDNFTYTVVSIIPNMAFLDDPMLWLRQFDGKPGKAAVDQAMQEFNAYTVRGMTREIVQTVPEWSRMPATGAQGPEDFAFGQLHEFWITPGKAEAFGASIKEVMAFFDELGYPYRIDGYRVTVGQMDRVVFVTFYDNQADYYGKNALLTMIEQKGMMDRWGEIWGRFTQTIDDWDDTTLTYRADLSYWGGTS